MGGLIAGNLCSILAMVSDTVSSSQKTAKGVLLVQSLSQIFYGMSAIFLKGYSAAVQNAVSLLRNIVAIRRISNRILEVLLVVAGVGLGLWFNNLGIIGLLPVVANLEYSLAVFRFGDNERALKIAFVINAVMYLVFNFAIWNFVGVVANGVVIVMTVLFLIKDRKKRNPIGLGRVFL